MCGCPLRLFPPDPPTHPNPQHPHHQKISKERIIWIYRHKLFQLNKPHLLDDLKRKPSASLVKSRTESTRRKQGPASTDRPVSASGGRRGRPFSPLCNSHSDSGMTTSSTSSSDTSPSSSPARSKLHKRKRQSSGSNYSLDTLTEAAASVGHRRGYDMEDGEEGMYSYWTGPSQEDEDEDEDEEEELFDEQDEDEACWVMKKMSRGHGFARRGAEEEDDDDHAGFEEGVQQLPEDDDLVMVMPTDYHYTSQYTAAASSGEKRRMEMEDKVQPQSYHRLVGHNEHQEEKSEACAPMLPSSAARRDSMHSRRSDMQTPVPPSPHSPAYHATAEERLAWAHVQQQWENAGPAQRETLIASLPTPVHEAWTGFFLVMAPFQTQAELIKACHSLLCTSPVLAVSVHQHRLALDPLAVASPDKTFLLQDEVEDGADADTTPSSTLSGSSHHTHKSKVVAAGHNHRALRDVLGFGLNHLVESVHALSKDDACPAAAALHECLEAWKGHTGRLL